MRRKSLIELAKRLRNSTGGSGGSPKSIKSNIDDDYDELKAQKQQQVTIDGKLDENGNIVVPPPRRNSRKSLTFAVNHTEVPPPPPQATKLEDKQCQKKGQRNETGGKRRNSRRSSVNCNDISANNSNDTLIVRPIKRRQFEESNRQRVETSKIESTTSDAGDSPEDKKGWSRIARQLQRMTNDELESFLNVDDVFVIDCLLDQQPVIRKLERERDDIRKQVSNLANFNYAREPEFVRDRLKLREKTDDVARMVRHITGKNLDPILDRISKVQDGLAKEARDCEESSEAMANMFLTSGKPYDEFIVQYVRLRKETSKKRTLADRLAKERDLLMSNILYKSLLLGNNNNNNDGNGNSNNSISSKRIGDDYNQNESMMKTTTTSMRTRTASSTTSSSSSSSSSSTASTQSTR